MEALRASMILVLVGVLALLAPLAEASPPDPSWIHGVYDDDDHDFVVIRITSSAGVVEPFPLDDASSIPLVIAVLCSMDEGLATSEAPSVNRARAPPAF